MGDHGAQSLLARLLALKAAGGPELALRVQELARSHSELKLTRADARHLLRRLHSAGSPAPRRGQTGRPAVSVVVPVHGTEAYLADCLNSLSRQTLKDLQIVVVDDASPDDSNRIILDFMLRDKRISFVRSGQNLGLLLARQAGVRFARGRYLAHVDSDDLVAPETYALALERAEATGAEIIQFGMQRLKGDQYLAHDVARPRHDMLHGRRILQAFLHSEINFSVCNKLYARDLWDRAAGAFPRRSYRVEDLAQNAVLMRAANGYASLPDPLYTYRITEDSDSRARDLASLRLRAVSAVRHVAHLKRCLHREGELTRLWPDVGALERRVHEDYVRPLSAAFGRLPPGARRSRRQVADTVRRLARLNGWLALKPWVQMHTSLMALRRARPTGRRPAVSVIIPVYNQPEFIATALQSALQQTRKDIEILVVDDGSNDATPAVIDEYGRRSRRVRLLRHDSNRGLLLARLTGVRAARGRYIAHLDADDALVPDALELLLAEARNSGADIVQCGFTEVRQAGTRNVLCRDLETLEGPAILDHFLRLNGISNAMWNKLYRRELCERSLPLMPRENQLAEDFCQNTVLMALAGKLAHVGAPLYRYTIRDGSGDRIQEPQRICERARSACFNMQQARYVAALARHPGRFSAGIKARETGYFTRMMDGLEALTDNDGLLVSETMAECCKLAPWPFKPQQQMTPEPGPTENLSAIDGVCERIRDGRARGWIVDKSDFSRIIGFDVYWDGVLIDRGSAGNHRGDLERLGWGNGRHGFAVDLPDNASDGGRHEFSICLAGTNVSLRKCPAAVRDGKAEPGPNVMGDGRRLAFPGFRLPWQR